MRRERMLQLYRNHFKRLKGGEVMVMSWSRDLGE